MKSIVVLTFLLSSFFVLSKEATYAELLNKSVSSNQCFSYFQLSKDRLQNLLKVEIGSNYQLNIWKHRATNANFRADELEVAIENLLKGSKVYSKELIGIGVSGAKIVNLSNDVQGVFKAGENWAADILSEVAAYRVDKLLNLDIVPITVQRKIDDEVGSIQLFVKDAKMASAVDAVKPLESDMAKLEILDYLISNSDRHKGNYLIKNSGQIIAIDHGLTFSNSDVLYTKMAPKFSQRVYDFLESQEGKKLMSVLKATTDKQVKKELKGLLKKKTVKDFIIRKNKIINLLN